MNETLQSFQYPDTTVADYEHWVVMVRPVQPTFASAVIAARSNVRSLADLTHDEAGQLPAVIDDYEALVQTFGQVRRVNYLALMMVDPNPHFHAIPRYEESVSWSGIDFPDRTFPKPPDMMSGVALDGARLGDLAAHMKSAWP